MHPYLLSLMYNALADEAVRKLPTREMMTA